MMIGIMATHNAHMIMMIVFRLLVIILCVLKTFNICHFMDYMSQKDFNIKLASWNCHGYKSSADYTYQLANSHHITFICEHWLLPCELSTVKDEYRKIGKTASLQSSVNPLEPLRGRPYGGIGFLCSKINGLSYQYQDCDCDRICALKVYKNQAIILTVIGVYLPCDNHTAEQTEVYMDMIDKIQCLVDLSDANAPVIIMGDMNAALPQHDTIAQNWYKKHPFGSRSLLLYEFLHANDMCVANFSYKQEVNYTFKRNNIVSYIDHVFIPSYMINNLIKCSIIDECADNLSDHLAISTTLEIDVPVGSVKNKSEMKTHPRGKWSNPDFQEAYSAELDKSLSALNTVDINSVTSETALNTVNKLYNSLCKIMHDCVVKCLQKMPRSKPFCGKSWWNNDCAVAKRRNVLFHHIWKESGCPSQGIIYDSYKCAKKSYRKACRSAVKTQCSTSFKLIDSLYKAKDSKSLWNIIRKTKESITHTDAISMEKLEAYFKEKFSPPTCNSDAFNESKERVHAKYNQLCNGQPESKVFMSVSSVKRYIKELNNGSSPGFDGISAEHLKCALHTKLPTLLSVMFSICLRHGYVPDAFRTGTLVPILKKSNIDPTNPRNYRPITVSVILSKIMELHVLDKISNCNYSPYQFGFVPRRGTNMATSLLHDVTTYCNFAGSSVFLCSLDAEGAFDCIPHEVLFDSAMSSLPDNEWKVLYYWYTNLCVHIRWNSHFSNQIKVLRGTRQGGLSSPALFNFFYYDMIKTLSESKSGIIINGTTYNIFCYADDLLLSSTSVTGLQSLINTASKYITDRGLRFNPNKTVCTTKGDNPFTCDPHWYIDGVPLSNEDHIKYLGTYIDQTNGSYHAQSRISNANKAFFSLQGAGLYKDCVSPCTAFHIYNTAVRSGIVYGCSSIYMSKKNLKTLETAQAKHIKSILGVGYRTHTTPILCAIGIPTVSQSVSIATLDLLRANVLSDSSTSKFYTFLLTKSHDSGKTLVGRSYLYANDNNINIVKYVFNNAYRTRIKNNLSLPIPVGINGMVDTVRSLIFTDFNQRNRQLLNNVLKAY